MIVENIQRLCKARSISLSSLERELNFGRGSIYKWESSSPSIDKIQKVADFFNVSVDQVLYGFELSRFEELFKIIMNKRTCEAFAKDSGIDLEIVENIAMGISTEKPSIEVVKKIAASNPHKVIVDDDSLFEAAGYTEEDRVEAEDRKIETIAAHHEGDDWTEEELEEIERFKAFVKSKRNQE